VEFKLGSPPAEKDRDDDESQHRKRIDWSFAIAAKPVTVEQFLRFLPDHVYRSRYAPTVDCPVNWTTWYEATEYCNWLSEKEGIPQDQLCYEPSSQRQDAEGMKLRLKANYLRLPGYRLPTEAEWQKRRTASDSPARRPWMRSPCWSRSKSWLSPAAVSASNGRDKTCRSWHLTSLSVNRIVGAMPHTFWQVFGKGERGPNLRHVEWILAGVIPRVKTGVFLKRDHVRGGIALLDAAKDDGSAGKPV
jgi:hypothetical protein